MKEITVRFQGNTLDEQVQSALRATEIRVRIQHAEDNFQCGGYRFHFLTFQDLIDSGMDVDAVQFLPYPLVEVEKKRKEVETAINEYLRARYGKADDTTVVVVSEEWVRIWRSITNMVKR